jgi:hypothetical protein
MLCLAARAVPIVTPFAPESQSPALGPGQCIGPRYFSRGGPGEVAWRDCGAVRFPVVRMTARGQARPLTDVEVMSQRDDGLRAALPFRKDRGHRRSRGGNAPQFGQVAERNPTQAPEYEQFRGSLLIRRSQGRALVGEPFQLGLHR